MYQAVQAHQLAQALHQIGAALLATFDLQELIGVLARDLPRLGIPGCFLALYEDPDEPAAWARLILAYDPTGPIELEASGRRFPSRQLLPAGMFPQDRRASLVVEPLHFQRQPLGYVVFEVGPRNGALYATLQAQISSALLGTQLVQRVRERSSELARQQYILDTFMENVPDYIYFKDLDGRITRANRAHALRLGLNDPAQEIGKSDFDFFPPELARVKYEQEQAIIRSGQPLVNLEEANDRGDWMLTTKMPLRDEHGTIIGTFGISRDITDLIRARQSIEAANRTLSKLNADKDKFFSIISHDLRGPFSTLLGGIELLAEGLDSLDQQDLHEVIQSIYRRAKLTYSLLENLLTWARLQREGGIECRPSPIDLKDLVQETLAVLDPLAARKEIELSNALAADTWVHADRNMLETVVRNLTGNAIKFTPRGGRVTWGARREDTGEPPGYVIAWVKDTGVGMSQADMSKLLRLDAHHSTPGTDNERGTGLGLIICQEMVERNGGQLRVQSEPGQGTTIEFTVPRLPRP
jgi:PAS domain S-box-containing protein